MFKANYYSKPSEKAVDATVRISGEKVVVEYYKNQVYTTEQFDISSIERIDEISPTCFIVTFKSQPLHSLEFSTINFINEIRTHKNGETLKVKTQLKSPRKVVWFISLLAFGFISLLVFFYFYALPVITEKIANKLPRRYESELGEKLYKANIANLEIDSSLTRKSQLFFNKLGITSDTITIAVVKSKEINAYAMPGGYIVVFDSIIRLMKGPGEFAALLAHEYAHIKFRHSLRGLVRQLTGSTIIGLLTGDSNGAIAILASQADKIKGLQYSREMERQADEAAVEMLYTSGIDPGGALELFVNMKAVTMEGSKQGFEFLSTHPMFELREKYIRDHIKKFPLKHYKTHEIIEIWQKLKIK